MLTSGFSAVSHRSVAARAGQSLAATTYYFASLDELLSAALRDLAQKWLDVARKSVEAQPRRLARGRFVDAVLGVLLLDELPLAAFPVPPANAVYERYLEAARHPGLQEMVRDFDRQMDGLVLDLLRRTELACSGAIARLVIAAADGAILRALAEGSDPRSARSTLQTLVKRLPSDPGAGVRAS